MNKLAQYLSFSPEVQKAMEAGRPIVALPSANLAHNMPYPYNVKAAQATAQSARENGAVCAVIAVLGGKLRIGLTDAEMEYLGRKGFSALRARRQDIPVLMANGADGATTLAATIVLSVLAGVRVLATPEIGGTAHKQEDPAAQADLEELGRTSAIVVCSGALPNTNVSRTLQQLETAGVAVVGYKTNEFPLFYSGKSGCTVRHRFNTAREIAAVYDIQESLGIRGGMLVVQKPSADSTVNPNMLSRAAQAAQLDAAQGERTKTYAACLQEQLSTLTAGKSREGEIQRTKENAELAAKIAAELD